MPRGAKPKQYPIGLVADVQRLYAKGMSQTEVALSLGISQKVVWRLMRRHGIPRRPQVKRDQRGSRNSSWRGSSAGYAAMHYRVAVIRGKPSICEHCGTRQAKRFEWANVNGHYDDPMDYKRLCASCHKRYDGIVVNLGKYARSKEATP